MQQEIDEVEADGLLQYPPPCPSRVEVPDPAAWITLIEFAVALLSLGHGPAGPAELAQARSPVTVLALVI